MPGLVALAGELPDSDPCHLNYHLIYFITIFFHTCRVRWENAGSSPKIRADGDGGGGLGRVKSFAPCTLAALDGEREQLQVGRGYRVCALGGGR